jgi:transcriptional regulator with XRE-family HTH domain
MSSSETCHDLPYLAAHDEQMIQMGKEIRALRESKGWSQAELAARMGVTRNAVSLWESDSNRPALPKIMQMIRLFNVDKLGDVNAVTERPLLPIVNEGLMPVYGYAAASTWQELDEVGQEPKDWLPISKDPAYGTGDQYAIEVRGTSMNLTLKDGDFAICIPAFGKAPVDGDLVVARRTRGGLVERTVKRYRETSVGKGVLMPESADPRHEPIPFTGEDGTTIEIEAFVIGGYVRLRRR